MILSSPAQHLLVQLISVQQYFRATIDGNSLTVLKQETAIPSAQAIVVNASTGTPVINEQFTNSLSRQIATSGIYVLRIETTDGALIGQFVVQ